MIRCIHLDIPHHPRARQFRDDPLAPLLPLQRAPRSILPPVELTPARLPPIRHVVSSAGEEEVPGRRKIGVRAGDNARAEEGVEEVDRCGESCGEGGEGSRRNGEAVCPESSLIISCVQAEKGKNTARRILRPVLGGRITEKLQSLWAMTVNGKSFDRRRRLSRGMTYHSSVRDHTDHQGAERPFLPLRPQLKDMTAVRPKLDLGENLLPPRVFVAELGSVPFERMDGRERRFVPREV